MVGRIKREGPLSTYEVEHDRYGVTRVDAISPEGSINAALKKWGGSWREDAGHCRTRWIGTALKPRCKRCHGEFGEPGDPRAYCPACVEIMAREKREAERHVRWARERRKRMEDLE